MALIISGYLFEEIRNISRTIINIGIKDKIRSDILQDDIDRKIEELSGAEEPVLVEIMNSNFNEFDSGNNLIDTVCAHADRSLKALNDLASNDSHSFFILVFSSPEKRIKKIISREPAPLLDIRELIDDWVNYNEELINFYVQNKHRALLINYDYLNQIGEQVSSKLHELSYINSLNNIFLDMDSNYKELQKTEDVDLSFHFANMLFNYSDKAKSTFLKLMENFNSNFIYEVSSSSLSYDEVLKLVSYFHTASKLEKSLKLYKDQLYINQLELERLHLEKQAEKIRSQLFFRVGYNIDIFREYLWGRILLPFVIFVEILKIRIEGTKYKSKDWQFYHPEFVSRTSPYILGKRIVKKIDLINSKRIKLSRFYKKLLHKIKKCFS